MEPVAYLGHVDEDGRLKLDSPNAFKAALAYYKGEVVILTLDRPKQTRSSKQNRAWWGIVIKRFAAYMGERDTEYVHAKVLEAIGHYEIKVIFGKEEKKVLPTRNLPTDEFAKLYEAAQQLGAEYGVMIPDPKSAQARAVMQE